MKKIIPLIILTFFLIIIGGILFIQNQNFKKEIGILNDEIAELEKPAIITPTPIAEKPPEGWKVYADDEYKFKITYPEKINYNGQSSFIGIDKYYSNRDKAYIIDFGAPVDNPPPRLLYIYIYNKEVPNLKDFIIEEIKDKTTEDGDLNNYLTQEKIDNLLIYKLKLSKSFISYYVKKDNKIFAFHFYDSLFIENPDQVERLSEQMVQSFKFIN